MKEQIYTIDFTETEVRTIHWLISTWYPDTKEDSETKESILKKGRK